MSAPPPTSDSAVAAFIARWAAAQSAERANYQLFLSELCGRLEVPRPDPAGPATEQNACVFERAVPQHGIGLTDLYNVLEKVRAALTRSRAPGLSASAPAKAEEKENENDYENENDQDLVLSPKGKLLHDQALVATLRQLHADLDAAVAAACGWPWALTDAEILERVAALNTARAAEEAKGTFVR